MEKDYIIASPESGYSRIRTSNITEDQYRTLSTQIINQLIQLDIKAIIFDFDGTLTKHHSFRKDNQNKLGLSQDWFADIEMLKSILEKGSENNLEFHIASKQTQEIITDILRQNNLLTYFTRINGAESDKKESISQIAKLYSQNKILYFDDIAEDIIDNNIIFLNGILPRLSHTKPRHKSQDMEGIAGLTFERWDEVSTRLSLIQEAALTQPNYDITSQTPLTIITSRYKEINLQEEGLNQKIDNDDIATPTKKQRTSSSYHLPS